jgi:hypothetical protein
MFTKKMILEALKIAQGKKIDGLDLVEIFPVIKEIVRGLNTDEMKEFEKIFKKKMTLLKENKSASKINDEQSEKKPNIENHKEVIEYKKEKTDQATQSNPQSPVHQGGAWTLDLNAHPYLVIGALLILIYSKYRSVGQKEKSLTVPKILQNVKVVKENKICKEIKNSGVSFNRLRHGNKLKVILFNHGYDLIYRVSKKNGSSNSINKLLKHFNAPNYFMINIKKMPDVYFEKNDKLGNTYYENKKGEKCLNMESFKEEIKKYTGGEAENPFYGLLWDSIMTDYFLSEVLEKEMVNAREILEKKIPWEKNKDSIETWTNNKSLYDFEIEFLLEQTYYCVEEVIELLEEKYNEKLIRSTDFDTHFATPNTEIMNRVNHFRKKWVELNQKSKDPENPFFQQDQKPNEKEQERIFEGEINLHIFDTPIPRNNVYKRDLINLKKEDTYWRVYFEVHRKIKSEVEEIFDDINEAFFAKQTMIGQPEEDTEFVVAVEEDENENIIITPEVVETTKILNLLETEDIIPYSNLTAIQRKDAEVKEKIRISTELQISDSMAIMKAKATAEALQIGREADDEELKIIKQTYIEGNMSSLVESYRKDEFKREKGRKRAFSLRNILRPKNADQIVEHNFLWANKHLLTKIQGIDGARGGSNSSSSSSRRPSSKKTRRKKKRKGKKKTKKSKGIKKH